MRGILDNAKNLNQFVSGSSALDNTCCGEEPFIYLRIYISTHPKVIN